MIVGGGDGGVLREVAKHPEIERIVMCEIDEQVVECAKKYFSNSTAVAFDDPRVELVFFNINLLVTLVVVHGCCLIRERTRKLFRCHYCRFF